MPVEGVWTIEVYGPFGWDSRGIFVFEKGRILGGDNRQYTAGKYSVSNDEFSAELRVHYYGPPRTVHGEASEEFETRLIGKIRDGTIEGTVGRPDRPEYDLQVRLTKRMDLS